MGTPAPGNGGTNEGAATQKPSVRHKGAATQKPTSERRNSRSNLGSRGRDPRTLASWRHLFSSSCRGNCWWDWTSTACGVLSRRHRLRVVGLLHLTTPIVQFSFGLGRFRLRQAPGLLPVRSTSDRCWLRSLPHQKTSMRKSTALHFLAPTSCWRPCSPSVTAAESSHWRIQVFPDGHLVIVLASGRLRILG